MLTFFYFYSFYHHFFFSILISATIVYIYNDLQSDKAIYRRTVAGKKFCCLGYQSSWIVFRNLLKFMQIAENSAVFPPVILHKIGMKKQKKR